MSRLAARTYRKVRVWKGPLAWIGIHRIAAFGGGQCILEVLWDRRVWHKGPRSNVSVLRSPLHGVHPATLLVESDTERPVVGIDLHTSLVDPLVVGPPPAVGGVVRDGFRNACVRVGDAHRDIPLARHLSGWNVVHGASLGSVQSRLYHWLVIDALDNVNLTPFGPMLFIGHPERGPHPTTHRHVLQVDNEQPAVEERLALQSNRLAWALGRGGCRHDNTLFLTILENRNVVQSHCLGVFLVDVRVVPKGWIFSLKEIVVVDKVVSHLHTNHE